MDFDNPGFRLLNLLEQGKKIPANKVCRDAWSELLDAPVASPQLLGRLGKVMELVAIVETEIREAYPDEASTCEHWTSQVKAAFMNQHLQGEWDTFIAHIDGHSLNYLRMQARMLQMLSNAKSVEYEVLEQSRNDLNDILNELLASEIDFEVKKYLSRNLRGLIAAIDEYKLTGTTGLFDSIEILVGHSFFDSKYKKSIKETKIGQKIIDTIGLLADAMTIATGLPQIGGAISNLIALSQK
ncbi:hypothetical protein [Methylomonas fluvii]|uniref:Uncharacterized protein n=1 Tax=Methylomonas fluvii TaxID=1854564 RepID=A0ABR9DKT2_9GAMM|nr:hypothetical protein [Methylomonas fluvii]MBD9363718.1 hypothetical protein [Methylomonas fluvii]